MEIIKNSISSTKSNAVADIKKIEVDLNNYIHFFNNTFDFNCIANVDGYFEIINPRFEKILGYSKKELLESRFLDFIYEDDIKVTLNEIEKLMQQYDIKLKRFENGNDYFEILFWQPYNSPVLDDNGNLLYIIHHVENITKRKKVEQ
jgi:PAS domain S-box-containing protein